MHSVKFKQVFIILLIFLFHFYGIWLSQVEAEEVSIAKDLGRLPVNNESLPTLNDSPSPDNVEEKASASDVADGKDLRVNPSINEDDQEIIADKEVPPVTSPITLSDFFPEEEEGVQTSGEFDDQPWIDPEDEDIPFVQEDKLPIDSESIGNEKAAPKEESIEISASETQVLPAEQSEIPLPVSDDIPASPDIVEKKEPASDVADKKTLRVDPSINEDDQKVVADKEVPSVTPHITLSDFFPEEEEPQVYEEREISPVASTAEPTERPSGEGESLAQEEEGVQTTGEFDGQPRNNPDGEGVSALPQEKSPIDHQSTGNEKAAPKEESIEILASEMQNLPAEQRGKPLPVSDDIPTSPEEEKPSISHLNTDKGESQDIQEEEEEEDVSSHVSESFPVTVHEEKTLSAFGMNDSGISGDTSPGSEDEQGIVTDKDLFPDVKEEEISPVASAVESSAHSSGESEPLVQEEEGAQRSGEFDDQPWIDPEDEDISFVQEDKLSIDSESIGNEKADLQETAREITTSEVQAHPIEQSEISLPTLDDSPSRDNVEEKTSASDVADGKDLRVNPSINEDKQEIVANKEIPSVTSPITHSGPSVDEEMPLIEEEGGREESLFTWKIWHSDPTHKVILAVIVALVAAKIGGWVGVSLELPRVVGKLMAGMILGNIYIFVGTDYFDFLKTMPFLKMLSYFGTLILLLNAGLHTDIRAILRVGPSSVLVCLGGMILPAGLGLIISHFLLPDISSGSKVLLAIVLCSTSTGFLFAILNELKIMNTLEGRVIVGATILTEIIVILSFGVVSGIVVEGAVSLLGMSVSFGFASLFLLTAVVIIFKYGEKFGKFLTKRLTEGLNIPIIVILSLLMAFMFGSIGLHTIIGAFIAGLFLRNVKLKDSDNGEHRNVESFIRPFYALLVPILFVRVGALVDLKGFLNLDAILLGIAITSAAIIGKMFCSVCPIEKGTNRFVIGFGMAMKLEGTLVLAGIGRDVGIFNDTVFSSFIMAIVFTSTVCPFFMKIFALRKKRICHESICIDPEKAELGKIPANKRTQFKIFGFSFL